MFITNNEDSFHLWRKKNLVKHQKASKYYGQDCSLANLNSRTKFEVTLKFLHIKLLGKGIQEKQYFNNIVSIKPTFLAN